MASRHPISTRVLVSSHIPTVMLIVGYLAYWVEMTSSSASTGVTSPLAAAVFLVCAALIFWKERGSRSALYQGLIKEFHGFDAVQKTLFIAAKFVGAGIITVAFWAALFPPHLLQEYDALNYHITIPRQHLILGSFAHIPWSTADLFLLPIDFALAPYWLMTELPNKFPQFLFLMGLICVAMDFTRRLTPNTFWQAATVGFAILGSHGIGNQTGTAMMDVVNAYLLVALIDSLLTRSYLLAGIEGAFYFWAKPFHPPQTVLIIAALVILYWVFKKLTHGHGVSFWEKSEHIVVDRVSAKRFLYVFFVVSFFVGGPFVGKSLYYSGTPLYPFGVGMFDSAGIEKGSEQWTSLEGATRVHLTTKDQYGHGRSVLDFIKHFWLIAVPEKGVNNAFDYPLGLPYLLFIGPFLVFLFQSMKGKVFPVLPVLIVLFWMTWWVGSQQSRFLFGPLVLLFICAVVRLSQFSRVLLSALFVALLLNGVSVVRAHRDVFQAHGSMQVLREKDKELIAASKLYQRLDSKDVIILKEHDAAFARFPFFVIPEKWPYVITAP